MRNRVATFIMTLGLLLWPVLAWGQSGGKVGVINLQEAIANTLEGKKALTDIQKKYQPRQADLQRQQQEIQALQDQLQKQAATLSDEERVRLSRDLDDKQKLFKRATEDATAEYQADNQDALRRMGQKMVRIINDYAQQNGYSLILEEGQVQPYFVTRDADLTAEIAKRYDAANPVEGAATSGAAATPAPVPSSPRPAATQPPAKPAAGAAAKPAENKPKP
ncbi:MAG: OmpH family outer membrane protein [Acidobacteriia bacterium]|nr:OmpH family outer membrane protein [Terriglobia bacterium]